MAMNDAGDMLASMGISRQEVIVAELKAKARKPRDQRICVCGHATNRHSMDTGFVVCQPSAYRCPCKNIKPVVEVEDTRMFLRKTTGPGAEHALARGLNALADSHKKAVWLEGTHCEICKTTETVGLQATPIGVFTKKIAYDGATGLDSLLCPECRESLIS